MYACIYSCVHWSDSVYSLAPHLCFCCKSLSMLAGAMYTSFETFAVQLIFYFNFIFELQMHSFFFLIFFVHFCVLRISLKFFFSIFYKIIASIEFCCAFVYSLAEFAINSFCGSLFFRNLCFIHTYVFTLFSIAYSCVQKYYFFLLNLFTCVVLTLLPFCLRPTGLFVCFSKVSFLFRYITKVKNYWYTCSTYIWIICCLAHLFKRHPIFSGDVYKNIYLLCSADTLPITSFAFNPYKSILFSLADFIMVSIIS